MASGSYQIADSTIQGAGQGAAVGGHWGALIGGVVGLLGGVVGVRAQRRAEEERRDIERRIKRELGIKLLRKRTAKLLPLYRGAAISELKGRIEGQSAANLARKGLTGTGAGEAVRGISMAITDIEANRNAIEGARNLGIAKANLLGAQLEAVKPRISPSEAALIGFARGALLTANRGTGDPKAPSTGLNPRDPDYNPNAANATNMAPDGGLWDDYVPDGYDVSAYGSALPGLRRK